MGLRGTISITDSDTAVPDTEAPAQAFRHQAHPVGVLGGLRAHPPGLISLSRDLPVGSAGPLELRPVGAVPSKGLRPARPGRPGEAWDHEPDSHHLPEEELPWPTSSKEGFAD